MHTVVESGTQVRVAADRPSSLACPACGGAEAKFFTRSRDYFFLRKETYDVVRCPGCHLCWLSDPPRPENMGLHYGNDYDGVITAPGDLYPHHWDVVRNKLLRYVQGGAILDIGCSSGSFLRTMKGPAWKLYGIEMSKTVADHARASTGAEVFVGDVLDATFPENCFDAVTAFHVLEHMHDARKVMARVFSWLKPGGIFTLTLPNIDSLEARMFGPYWFGLDVPRHLWQFSPQALANMGASVKLEPVEVGTAHSCYIEGSLRNRLLAAKERCGLSPLAPSNGTSEGLAFRILRKAFRLTFVFGFKNLAAAAGDGADVHAIFRKPLKPTDRNEPA